jgi:hypothetical protein
MSFDNYLQKRAKIQEPNFNKILRMLLSRIIILKKKPNTLVLLSLFIGLFFFSCSNEHSNPVPIAAQYNVYCGSCHMTPDPKNIPRDIWEDHVLPEMAARMGYKYGGYNPISFRSQEERQYINLDKTYPEQPIIDNKTWWSIHDYIISLAPYAIPIDTTRKDRNKDLADFSIRKVDISELTVPIITDIQFDTIRHFFNIGDAAGNLYQWPISNATTVVKKFNSAITSYHHNKNTQYATEIGILNPSEVPKGIITKISSGITDTIAENLHRPVFMENVDLNDDGVDEMLICEFGDLTGQLTLLEQKELGYDKKSLYPQPGAIKFEIADMNQDKKKDIVVLFSQGDEGIVIFYQKNDLTFSSEQVIRLPPEYGSSWFELIDYDTDGDLDIVLTNGDNADYSIFLKPFHGIRLFMNDGMNGFNQKWFYPAYGATRVLAHDYDLDGDIDFAVTALFNDTENSPKEGFIYFKNLNSKQFKFQPYTLQGSFTNGWLTMAKGDYDSDGDMDIMLGSFNVKGLRNKNSIFESKEKDPIKLLLLENQENHR